MHFFSKGQKKTRNVRSQKKQNVDIPSGSHTENFKENKHTLLVSFS